MAIRQIRVMGDELLTKQCKEVTEITPKIKTLIEDMFDTMYEAQGVGLAAPQVGVRKRIVVIDVTEEGNEPLLLINPEIIETDGEQIGNEGCLSVPGQQAQVKRANYAKVKAYDADMKEITIEGEGLLARCLQHEIDHLEGHLYVERAEPGTLVYVDREE